MTTPDVPPNATVHVTAFRRKGSFLRTVKAVMWSFVGLRARGDYEKDVEQLNPVHIVIVGLIGVIVFVSGLIFLAIWVSGK